MRWLCWFVPHKWIPAIDERYVQCERCPKLTIKPPQKKLPRGARECPFPDCAGFVTPPPTSSWEQNGKIYYATMRHTRCSDPSSHQVRWERNQSTDDWPDPIAVVS